MKWGVCWQNPTASQSIHSGDKQWIAIHSDVVESVPKTRVLLAAYKQQACCAVRKYDSVYRRSQESIRTYKSLVRNFPQTELLPVFKKNIKQVRASVQARGWHCLTFVLTRVNMRNVFYYKLG